MEYSLNISLLQIKSSKSTYFTNGALITNLTKLITQIQIYNYLCSVAVLCHFPYPFSCLISRALITSQKINIPTFGMQLNQFPFSEVKTKIIFMNIRRKKGLLVSAMQSALTWLRVFTLRQ